MSKNINLQPHNIINKKDYKNIFIHANPNKTMIWWLIIIGFFLIAILFLKFEHNIKKWKLILLLIVLIFLFFSIKSIVENNNTDIKSPGGIMNTIYIYFGWLGDKGLQVLNFGEIAINTIGNSIKEIKSENDDRN